MKSFYHFSLCFDKYETPQLLHYRREAFRCSGKEKQNGKKKKDLKADCNF